MSSPDYDFIHYFKSLFNQRTCSARNFNSEVRSRLAYDIQNQHVLHKIELKCTGEKKHCMFICDLAVNLIIKVPQAKPGELIN